MENIENVREQIVSKIGIKNIVEYLMDMGFTITPCDDNEKLVKVTIPENYMVTIASETNHSSKTNDESKENFRKDSFSYQQVVNIDFYDETKTKRGSFVVNKKNPIGSTIILSRRINLYTQNHGAKNEYREFFIGTSTQKLISFGSVNTGMGSQLYIMNQAAELTNKLKSTADEIYPGWHSPTTYWELTDEELVAMLPKTVECATPRKRTNPKND